VLFRSNPESIRLVQASFAQVAPIAEQAASLFYARLFELAPELRPLFRGDMAEQGRKLMAMLATVVGGLSRLDTLVPAARALAQRHVAYGAQPEHYAVVGTALLDTLAKGLGDDFTPEVRAAWIEAYGLLSGAMLDAHRAAEVA
jgi:nitric oxide dioxygenase